MPWSAWTTRSPGESVASSSRKAAAAFRLAPRAEKPVPEHVLFGQDRDVARGEAVVERKHEQRRLGLGSERVLPCVNVLLRFEAVLVEQPAQAFTRTSGVARKHVFSAVATELR